MREKLALLQNKKLDRHWVFANVLMSEGKKGAGKRINLKDGRVKKINFVVIFYGKNRSNSIADNGKSIGEGRATLLTIPKENRPEQNAFSDF